MTDLILSGAIQARHNWGRWIADCGNCGSALTIPPGTPRVQCWDCGFLIGPIVWPADPVGIETVLSYRPDPNTRSWEPHETIEDLMAENFEHGIVPPEWLEASESDPQLLIAEVVDQQITGGLVFDALPAGDPRRVLAAARAESHSLGLPYIEDDGYPSYPSPPELEG